MSKPLKIILKIIASVLIIALAVVGIVFIPYIPETIDSKFIVSMHTDRAPKLIAHRGLSSIFPENTYPAFLGAIEYDFYAFELDIKTTEDGKWVVFHDDDVDYMSLKSPVIDRLLPVLNKRSIVCTALTKNTRKVDEPLFRIYIIEALDSYHALEGTELAPGLDGDLVLKKKLMDVLECSVNSSYGALVM